MNTRRLQAETSHWRFLLDQLRASGETDMESLQDTLEGETSFRECVAAVIRARREDEARVDALKQMIHDMTLRRVRYENRAEAMKDAVAKAMVAAEVQKIEEPDFTVSIRKGTPKVQVTESFKIPGRYWRPAPEVLDKAMMKRDLEAGHDVRGATLSNAEPTITVRVK